VPPVADGRALRAQLPRWADLSRGRMAEILQECAMLPSPG
jgi:hypothetical protein